MKRYFAFVLAFAGFALGAPTAFAGNVDCFHEAQEDPIACITAGLEGPVPQPQGTVVFRDKDCNYLVVKPEASDTFAFVHKVDGERPKLFTRLFGFLGFDQSFVDGKARRFRIDNGLETVRVETVASELDATQAAELAHDHCKDAQ